MTTIAKATLGVELGLMIRNNIITEVMKAAQGYGCQVEYRQGPGWLSAYYSFTFSGEPERVELLTRALSRWFKSVRATQ